MTRAKLLWCLKLLGCVLLTFAVINLLGPVRNLLWLMLHNAGRITDSRSLFNSKTYVMFYAATGFLLGCVPLGRVTDIFSAWAGKLHRKSAISIDESDWSRPILWTWSPFFVCLLLRFVFFQSPDASVFGDSTGVTRWKYFFTNEMLWQLNVGDRLTSAWIVDRILLTGPFALAAFYTIAVQIRMYRNRSSANH